MCVWECVKVCVCECERVRVCLWVERGLLASCAICSVISGLVCAHTQQSALVKLALPTQTYTHARPHTHTHTHTRTYTCRHVYIVLKTWRLDCLIFTDLQNVSSRLCFRLEVTHMWHKHTQFHFKFSASVQPLPKNQKSTEHFFSLLLWVLSFSKYTSRILKSLLLPSS